MQHVLRSPAFALLTSLALLACDGSVPDSDAATPEQDSGPEVMPDGGPVVPPDAGSDGGTEPSCTDECASASQSCEGTDQYRICGQYDLDPCLELSPPIHCAEGFSCIDDACVPPCRDECPVGGTLCADEETVLLCGNFDADACREPGGAVTCGAGERCEQGACVDESAACTDECGAAGETVCFGDAVRSCGEFDSDACLDLGPPVSCGPGAVCEAGECVAYCVDECPAIGATECVGDGVRTCGDFDADRCREWSAIEPCAGGESCSAGACSASCTHDCDNPGGSVCTVDGSGVRMCGEFDSDSCRDLASAIYCPVGFSCQSGVCVASCTNDCTLGTGPRCGADGASVQTCGNFDDDVCTEWGGDVSCPGGSSCSEGACDTPCSDECPSAGATRCEGDGVQTCGQYDLDACLEWSSPSACAGWESCEDGACVLGPTPAAVVINELLYDAAGVDTAAGNTLFVELWGPPGAPLDGWAVVGVDGNGGADYNRIGLDGFQIGSDGYFVIAHPNGAESVLSVADMTSSSVDYQNGPDSVQLRWRGRVVDALGYGTFGSGAIFAGEGTAAPAVAAGRSLTRDAAHTDTDVNSADFTAAATPSPRAATGGGSCSDECPSAGAVRCNGIQVQTCVADYDSDPCLEWNAPAGCPNAGEQCTGEGLCAIPCTDECTAGARQCTSDTQYQTCGDYDADSCTEWSAPSACGAGEECQGAGECSIPCTHECAVGETRCSGTQIQTCGNFDADACREWSAPAACPSGQSCSGTSCRDASAPEVVLISPQGTVQTTQGNVHRMIVDATAAPGRTITAVHYFANGMMVDTTTAAPHETSYVVPAGAATGSTITLHATAVDNAGSVGTSAFAYLDVRNDVPVAAFTATITNVSTVTVDASASSDTETPSAMLEVCWDWDNDGSCDTPYSTEKMTTHDFGASGTFTIGMTVRDAVGQTARTTRTVTFTDIQYIGGTTITSTLWYGTVVVTGDITVPAGETLSIAPGTQVQFIYADVAAPSGVGDYGIDIAGVLDVQGTAESPVVFTGQDSTAKVRGGWDRIILRGSTASTVRHALVEYADVGFDVRNGSLLEDVTVRETRGECVRLNNADNATLTRLTVTSCGDDGVHILGGSTGVSIDTLSSTSNGGDGLELTANSAAAVTTSTLAGNSQNGARAGTGSTLDLSASVVETNDERGLFFVSSSRGSVLRNQIRQNGKEGVAFFGDGAGQPNPVVQLNDIYSNAQTGSARISTTNPSLSVSHTCCSSATSSMWSPPAGFRIRRAYFTFNEGTSTPSDSGTLLSQSGATLASRTTTGSEWVYIPEGVTGLSVRASDNYSSDTETASVTSVELVSDDGASDVVAATESGTVDLRYNYLGTFPNVLSRVSMTRNTAVNLQGFVGAAMAPGWDTGPYYGGGGLGDTSWSGTVYITGSVTIPAGQTVSAAPGTRVLFVDTDQNGDGQGDWQITANGRLDLLGAAGNPVVVTGHGAPEGDDFQTITLAGSSSNASTWHDVQIEHGRVPVTLTGGSSLSRVTVAGGSGDGVAITAGTGASLEHVSITGAGSHGLRIGSAQSVDVSYLSSRDNAGAGIQITNNATATIEDSSIRDNDGAGIWVNGASPTLRYNLVQYNSGPGLHFEAAGTGNASYNIVKFNGDVGVLVEATSAGQPAPTVQYNNIYSNAADGASSGTTMNPGLSITHTCCSSSTSGTWTVPAGMRLRRALFSFNEGTSTPSDSATLLDQSGATLVTLTSTASQWVYIPEGVTSLRVRVSDNYSSDTETASVTSVELVSQEPANGYQLSCFTESGTTDARFNYWTPSVGTVPSLIHESRAGAVNHMGATGLEYPSGTVMQVGPRPE